jgi:hypothetical protein
MMVLLYFYMFQEEKKKKKKNKNMVHDDHVTMVYFLWCVSNFINEGMYRNKYIILLL